MDPGEAGQEAMEGQHNIRDDSEVLVSEQHAEIRPVNLDNAPNPSPVQQTVMTTPSTSIFRFLSRQTNLNPNVTDRSRRITPVEPLSTASREDLLVNLREETESAELRAKLARADEATALARRNTKLLDLEALELDRKCNVLRTSRSPSPPLLASPRSTGSMPTPPADVLGGFLAVLQSMEQARRADLQLAEERAERQEARHQTQAAAFAALQEERHQAQLAAMAAAHPAARPPSVGRYVVGVALTHVVPEFTGDGSEDWGAYRRSFEGFATAHGIPESHWPNELFIKLREKAKSWYENTFPADTFPPWGQLTSGLQRRFGLRYAAAEAWTQLCAATRQPNESGPGALQRIQELQRTLARLGVPSNPGPIERMCYLLQQQLTSDEKPRWIAAANATADVSDDAIHDLEAAATTELTATGRQSLAVEERDPWFRPRLEHLTTFLRDQPNSPGVRGPPARAAALVVETVDAPGTSAAAVTERTTPLSSIVEITDGECRLRVARANRIAASTGVRQPHGVQLPPPEYFGPNPQHEAQNKGEFEKRKTLGACFTCPNKWVTYTQNHLECPFHGTAAPSSKRNQGEYRVKGALLPGRSN
jgi:hypothetical protein